MATLPTQGGVVTLADWAKTRDPDGTTAAVIEMMNQNNTALQDVLWKEGNLPTGHQTTVRTGLPQGTWRKLNYGVQPTKSNRAQITDTCGLLEDRSQVDIDIADLNGNSAAFRLSEAEAHVEGLTQQWLNTLFYGDTDVYPERFTGLSPRYNTMNTAVPVSQNVLDAGGTGSDNTSIWLVVWGENTVCGIYPNGSKAGLEHKDLGEIDATDDAGGKYRVLADLWKWKSGLSVRDWRYAVRIANIDVSDLKGMTGTQADTAATNIVDMMIRAMAVIPNIGKGRPVFYMGRGAVAALPLLAKKAAQAVLAIQPGANQFGTITPGFAGAGNMSFLGVPIRTTDALLNTEARVTA